jgi:hypothetical protein
MAKESDPKSGRVAFDERGMPTWEWRVDTAPKRDLDRETHSR